MTTDLKALIGTEIMESDSTRMLRIKGVTKAHKVMIIPLDKCLYNDLNGRISTYISQHIANGNVIDKNDTEAYNAVIEDFIYQSNPKALDTTKKNIDTVGQLVAGVVLNDGTIIDGNRRFTALRKLKAAGKDVYFHAVILDESEGINRKDIKMLELQLQHAEEKPVDYNPIDNLVDVYRDIIENELFEIPEYTVAIGKDSSSNKDLKEVKLLVKKSVLMVQFLEFINAPKQYYIARDFNLDGPLQEMVGIIERALKGIDILTVMNKDYHDKNEQAQYIRIRNSLFATVFAARSQKSEESGDLSRYIRETGKYIINSSNNEDFLEKFDDIVEDMMETFEETSVTLETLSDVAKDLSELNSNSLKIVSTKIEDAKREKAQIQPVDSLNSALKQISSIPVDQVKHMNDKSQHEFILVYEEIQKKLELLGKALHV
ncbi:hypothetical protein MHB65_20110 [Lysinibacillus sp. FSL K6-0075]|uniref:hypothetical protein n=1 Tax=Lysinibacillus sp. FSL K6-0075 TaxID=2921415 RepID=UPI0031589608